MDSQPTIFKEAFARFLEEPNRVSFKEILKQQMGELDEIDFKGSWIEYPKLARHILGIANSGGGCIVFGVAQADDGSLNSIGLSELKDKADVSSGINKFLPQQLKYHIWDFYFPDSEYGPIQNKKFQVLCVKDTPVYLPFIAQASSGNNIQQAAIYVRRGTKTEEVNYQELQAILNRRLETNYSTQSELDLEAHISHLSVLYKHVPRNKMRSLAIEVMSSTLFGGMFQHERNPNYPDEDFEAFIVNMIKAKKRRIEIVLDVDDL